MIFVLVEYVYRQVTDNGGVSYGTKLDVVPIAVYENAEEAKDYMFKNTYKQLRMYKVPLIKSLD